MKLDDSTSFGINIKWPRGEMGNLPDDAEQNLRLNHVERDVAHLEILVDELRQKDCK